MRRVSFWGLSPGARGYASPRGAWVPPRSTARPPRGRASGLTLGGGSGACIFVRSSVPGRLAAAVLRGRQAHGAVDASHVQKPTPKTGGGAHPPPLRRRWRGLSLVSGSRRLLGAVPPECPAHATWVQSHLSQFAPRRGKNGEQDLDLPSSPAPCMVTARLRGRPPSAQRRRAWGSSPPPRAAQI